MRTSDPILIDSNVLVYAHNEDSQLHNQALKLITDIASGNILAVLSIQNLIEFYSVITDKRRVLNPLPTKNALELINQYLFSPFKIIYPNSDTEQVIIKILGKNDLKNGQVFDAFLAATMISNNVSGILTANVKDFENFKEIEVFNLKNY